MRLFLMNSGLQTTRGKSYGMGLDPAIFSGDEITGEACNYQVLIFRRDGTTDCTGEEEVYSGGYLQAKFLWSASTSVRGAEGARRQKGYSIEAVLSPRLSILLTSWLDSENLLSLYLS
jgi:hypothetical protein